MATLGLLFSTGGLSGLDLNPLRAISNRSGGWLYALCGAIIGLVGLKAVVAPPMTVDAMVYHMPRVFFWLQNGSVDIFPTAAYQILFAPGAEFQILQWHLFVDFDLFSNVPQ